jgi:hypothetical protein
MSIEKRRDPVCLPAVPHRESRAFVGRFPAHRAKTVSYAPEDTARSPRRRSTAAAGRRSLGLGGRADPISSILPPVTLD